MRKWMLLSLLLPVVFIARADHITGGEMFYTYDGTINGEHYYKVTLKLFMRCNANRQFPSPAIISVFDKMNMSRIMDREVFLSNQRIIELTNPDPCITNPPRVCYEVAFYNFTITLPRNANGYLLSSQVNFRINGISNLDGSSQIGAMYTCEIPGTIDGGTTHTNKSAVFTGSDLVIVCAGNYFSYSFAARDDDADELRYSFCAAYRSTNLGINNAPPANPPYSAVPYGYPAYSEFVPLGNRVTIDEKTGMISGVAPPEGVYVVTVCVNEIRNGVVIATQRKDLQINVADCSVAGAVLEEKYMLCGETRTIKATNLSNSPLINTYDWSVFSTSGIELYTSQTPTLNYDFASNGNYRVQLIVNRGKACSDTTLAPVVVFPGLKPAFSATGICISKPSAFTDESSLQTGAINSWTWDFGEPGVATDVSSDRNARYTYPTMGTKTIQLTVTTTEGCRGTVSKLIDIVDKPPIRLAFRDTVICVRDIVQLKADGIGDFVWSPTVAMTGSTRPDPIVSPSATTKYYVTLDTEGCVNRDSVQVQVVSQVRLKMMSDTSVCSGDTIKMRIESDALSYRWSPSDQFLNPNIKEAFSITASSTNYELTASTGGCIATANVFVETYPYPTITAGADTTICFNTTTQLRANTNADQWTWMSSPSLSSIAQLNPVASPAATQRYIFTAVNTVGGCMKPVSDTVIVTVLPKIIASAGRDTSIVVGQPLQLHASGGDQYSWSPAIGLSATGVPNPVAVLNEPSMGMKYKVDVFNSIGCRDSAFIVVKIFASPPTVFVPSAFTPNNDGINDVLRPVLAGMQRFDYFQVFNRWGQLVFSTANDGQGWNGLINGQAQASNTYVWVVKAVDFNGHSYLKKGTVTLIR